MGVASDNSHIFLFLHPLLRPKWRLDAKSVWLLLLDLMRRQPMSRLMAGAFGTNERVAAFHVSVCIIHKYKRNTSCKGDCDWHKDTSRIIDLGNSFPHRFLFIIKHSQLRPLSLKTHFCLHNLRQSFKY